MTVQLITFYHSLHSESVPWANNLKIKKYLHITADLYQTIWLIGLATDPSAVLDEDKVIAYRTVLTWRSQVRTWSSQLVDWNALLVTVDEGKVEVSSWLQVLMALSDHQTRWPTTASMQRWRQRVSESLLLSLQGKTAKWQPVKTVVGVLLVHFASIAIFSVASHFPNVGYHNNCLNAYPLFAFIAQWLLLLEAVASFSPHPPRDTRQVLQRRSIYFLRELKPCNVSTQQLSHS